MTPLEATQKKEEFTGHYSRASEQLEVIEVRRLESWQVLREKHKSNADAVRAWESSLDGIEALKLKMKMDRMQKTISVCNSLLQVKNNEARNTW